MNIQKKRQNAVIPHLLSPKSALMVFHELYKDVPIKLQNDPETINGMGYIATLEIDGQLYTGRHISKTEAKQKACKNFLCLMLIKKLTEQSEKKEEHSNDIDIEEEQPKKDFPWQQFASLAMYYLIDQWELKDKLISSSSQSNSVELPPKTDATRKFPDDPKKIHSIQLMYQMIPNLKFDVLTICVNNPPLFKTTCIVDNILFTGEGSSKKEAKKECCIAAIKYFWKFDYHA